MATGDKFCLNQHVAGLVNDAGLEPGPPAHSHGPLPTRATWEFHHPRVVREVPKSGLEGAAALRWLTKCHPHRIYREWFKIDVRRSNRWEISECIVAH